MRERAPLLARSAKAVPAMVVSPQSFGDLLVPHSYAHAAVSLGLFRKDGVYFPLEDLDFSGLEEVFRERFFQGLLRRKKILPETVGKFKSWDHSGFHVGWRERKIEAEDRRNLESLLSYMERPAVSLRRLRYLDDGMVHYQGTRFHPRLGIDHQLLTPLEFLALLIPHVALTYEVTIRSYGALSTTFRRYAGWIQNPPVPRPPPEATPIAAIADPDPAPPPRPSCPRPRRQRKPTRPFFVSAGARGPSSSPRSGSRTPPCAAPA